MATFFDLTRIYPFIKRNAPELYWFFQYIFVIITLTYIAILGFIDYSVRIRKFYFLFPVQLLRRLSLVFYYLLLVPIVDFVVSLYECENDTHVIADMACWTGVHIAYCVLFSLGLALFLCTIFAIAFFYNESRPFHTDSLSRLDINFEIYLVVYRILLTAVSHFAQSERYRWPYLALHFAISLHLLKIYHKYVPYYNKTISTLVGACCIAYLWVIANVVLIQAADTIDYRG